jgi:hypothetical protein
MLRLADVRHVNAALDIIINEDERVDPALPGGEHSGRSEEILNIFGPERCCAFAAVKR